MRTASFHSLGLPRGQVSLQSTRILRERIAGISPDLVQGWLYHGNFASMALGRLAPSLVWSIHNTSLSPHSSKRTTRFLNRICAIGSHVWPDRILYASAQARDIHERAGYARRKGLIIENGVDLERFRFDSGARLRLRNELGIAPGERLIGSVGRFDPQKDHETLARAFARLASARPDVRLALVGNGCTEESEVLVRCLRDAGILDRSLLLGTRSDMSTLMSALDLLVISSAYGEAFPVVGLEAAAADLPVIATDVGEVRAVVIDESDIVPPRRPDELGAAMICGLERYDPERREALSAARRRRIEIRYSLAAMADRYAALYTDLLDHAKLG
jgi:glycosyltransferase involved in cell wall biosynthesis